MRIIAGKHKSRKLITLEGLATRPMTDRMKESVFNTIGPYLDGETVLDLFGGSGALTLEAISRGAKKGYIVEKSNSAVKIIKANVEALKEENNVVVYQLDYKVALKKLITLGITFDIVFLDPPYSLNIVKEIIDYLLENSLINDNGIIICQYVRGNYIPKESEKLKIRKNYTLASSEVCIYDYNNSN